jgi:hypothetical protein
MAPADAQFEIARLRAEVNRLRTELDNAREVRGQATGGSGTGGSGMDLENVPVASATFEGRVRVVSEKQVEVVDRETGDTYLLQVDKGTSATQGGQRIPVQSILAGSDVRASFDLIADGASVANQIEVLPRGQQSRQGQQGQQTQQGQQGSQRGQ